MNWLKEHKNQVQSFLIGFLAFAFVLFIACGVYLYRQRKATEAEIALRNMEANSEAANETVQDQAERRVRLDGDTVEWKGKTYKKNSYMKSVLCMGVDRSNEMTETKELGEAGQADGIFLIAQDTARNELKVLMIPRDTMTEITKLNSDGSVRGKEVDHLSMAYAFGDGREKSCENVVESVSRMFHGFPIDQYMAADTAIINTLNDAVGGVTVTVPTPGMEKQDPAFVQGEKITLMGEQAMWFVRYRDIEQEHSALFRMNQQKEYIAGFFEAVQKKSREDSQIVTRLFEMTEDYMVTNMAKDQYLKVALDAVESNGLDGDDFFMIPGSSVPTETFDEFHVSEEEMIELLLSLFYREVS